MLQNNTNSKTLYFLRNARARSANRPRSMNSSTWNSLVPKKYKNLSSIPDLRASENKWTKMPFKQTRTGQNDPVSGLCDTNECSSFSYPHVTVLQNIGVLNAFYKRWID